jgi:hypothetical protein
MAVSVPSTADLKKAIPSLGTPAWVALIGLGAVLLLLALAYGFKPLNLK